MCDAEALAFGPVKKSKKPIFNTVEDEIALTLALVIECLIELMRIVAGRTLNALENCMLKQ